MKLRMKNNSVRLRLSQTEAALFAETGRVEEAIEFGLEPHQRLIYAVESISEIEQMRATMENNRVTVLIPKRRADEWSRTAQIGIEAELPIGGGKVLRLLIEKDFACLEPRAGNDETKSQAGEKLEE
jgi:hypothetical protein